MKFISFFKSDFLEKNFTVKEILDFYDSSFIDKKDGKYSKKEVSVFIESSIKSWGTFLLGNNFMTNTVFKFLDVDKDSFITPDEINSYLEKHYNQNISDIKNMTVSEVCNELDKIDELKKKSKKTNP